MKPLYECDICGAPADPLTTVGALCEKHKVNFQKKKPKKDKKVLPIGGSETVPWVAPESVYEPKSLFIYPDGYMCFRTFCRQHGKSLSGYSFNKLSQTGDATLFRGERIVKISAVWPNKKQAYLKERKYPI